MLAIKYLPLFWILAEEIRNIHGLKTLFIELIPIMLSGVGAKAEVIETNSLLKCTILCISRPTCQSATFDKDTGICYINHVTLSSSGVAAQYNKKYKFMAIPDRNEEGVLVFRASGAVATKVFDSWTNIGHNDFNQISSDTFGCFTVNSQLPCNKHIRSWRLDYFKDISEIKFAFYTDSQPVFFVTFNAIGANDLEETFKLHRIVNSSVTQLINYREHFTFESIKGLAKCGRRFILDCEWDLCTTDLGWMMVRDGVPDPVCCDYDKTAPFPGFLYTKKQHYVNFGNAADVGLAEVFAVFVKYM